MKSCFLSSVLVLYATGLALASPSSIFKRAEGLEWVDKWAAIGDSYAAGIGAGSLGDGDDDGYYSRYKGSYPYQLKERAGFGGGMQFLAMSGAESWQIKDQQVTKLDAPKVITLSAGGNDVGLTNVLNHCVYQFAPGVKIGHGMIKNLYKCKDAVKETRDKIFSEKFHKDLTDLLAAALGKLDPQGTLFWTGYSRFFNAETDHCDNVSWSIYIPTLKVLPEFSEFEIAYLTKEVRRDLNELVDLVNEKIRELLEEETRAVFVEYQDEFVKNQGLYCEEGVREPDWMREKTMFYEIPQGGEVPEWIYNLPIHERDDPLPREGSIERLIWDAVYESQSHYNDKLRLEEGLEEALKKRNPDFTFSWDPLDMARTVKDLAFRVFHPTVPAHHIIANKVIDAMHQRYSSQPPSNSCPVYPLELMPTSDGCNSDDNPKVGKDNAKDRPYVPAHFAESKVRDVCKLFAGQKIDSTEHDMITTGSAIVGTKTNSLWFTVFWGDSCDKSNHVVDENECVETLLDTIHSCDTWTTWYKYGGRKTKGCLVYTSHIKGSELGVPEEVQKSEPHLGNNPNECFSSTVSSPDLRGVPKDWTRAAIDRHCERINPDGFLSARPPWFYQYLDTRDMRSGAPKEQDIILNLGLGYISGTNECPEGNEDRRRPQLDVQACKDRYYAIVGGCGDKGGYQPANCLWFHVSAWTLGKRDMPWHEKGKPE